ncbi:hypothetical protein L6452_18093 [Arctium lappa]|uniref:Uncharacterized protein n=1 Tax=Arctium lappa TaxID=4217 RepID=A0ACB9C5D7_ARCLA|nr:hypothetical protein L6452_18093 [Arctium lappa]
MKKNRKIKHDRFGESDEESGPKGHSLQSPQLTIAYPQDGNANILDVYLLDNVEGPLDPFAASQAPVITFSPLFIPLSTSLEGTNTAEHSFKRVVPSLDDLSAEINSLRSKPEELSLPLSLSCPLYRHTSLRSKLVFLSTLLL